MTLLSPLTPADIPEVMRIERLPGYDAYVGRWEAEEHAAQMASPDVRYFGVREGDGLCGFVILQDFRAPDVRLRRIAVAEPGRGLGGRVLREIMDWTFETAPQAESFWLDVHVENPRARRAYVREGFAPDGRVDAVHERMSIPRDRWAGFARRAGNARAS